MLLYRPCDMKQSSQTIFKKTSSDRGVQEGKVNLSVQKADANLVSDTEMSRMSSRLVNCVHREWCHCQFLL